MDNKSGTDIPTSNNYIPGFEYFNEDTHEMAQHIQSIVTFMESRDDLTNVEKTALKKIKAKYK